MTNSATAQRGTSEVVNIDAARRERQLAGRELIQRLQEQAGAKQVADGLRFNDQLTALSNASKSLARGQQLLAKEVDQVIVPSLNDANRKLNRALRTAELLGLEISDLRQRQRGQATQQAAFETQVRTSFKTVEGVFREQRVDFDKLREQLGAQGDQQQALAQFVNDHDISVGELRQYCAQNHLEIERLVALIVELQQKTSTRNVMIKTGRSLLARAFGFAIWSGVIVMAATLAYTFLRPFIR